MTKKLSPQTLAHRLMTFAESKAIVKFVDEQDIDFDLPNEQGCTLLITACAFDRVELIPLLVSKTNNIKAATLENMNNVLHFAALSQHPLVMKTILKAHSSKLVQLINTANANGDTPLMVACTSKHLKSVEALLAHGANIECINSTGTTALMCAACLDTEEQDNSTSQESSHKIVKQIIHSGLSKSLLNQVNILGQSALHLAVQSRNTPVILTLLEAGIQIDIRNKSGFNAVEVAEAAPYYDADALHAMRKAWTELVTKKENDLMMIADEIPIATQSQSKKKKSKKSSKKTHKAPLQASFQLPSMDMHQEAENTVTQNENTEVSPKPRSVIHSPEDCSPSRDSLRVQKVPFPTSTKESDECIQCTMVQDVLFKQYPLFQDMEISALNFLMHDIEHLSMSQLEILQEAHMHAYHALNERKIQVARQLEAERVQAHYELEHQLLRRAN